MSEYSWLDDDAPAPLDRKELTRIVKQSPALQELEHKARELTSPRARLWIMCYLESAYDPRAARDLYIKRTGKAPAVGAWRRDPVFNEVVDLAESAVYRTLGITRASVLAMTREALDKARSGGDLGHTKAFLELLGKHLKLWAQDEERQQHREGPALNITINAARPVEVIDVTPSRVDVVLPKP